MSDFVKVGSNGESFEIPNAGIGLGVKTITGAETLDYGDSGKLLVLSAAGGAAITLPAVAAGLKYKFVIGAAFATTDWVITAASSVIEGSLLVAGAAVVATNENTITFVATAETVGDYVELLSDGTNWYLSGVGAVTGSITATVV